MVEIADTYEVIERIVIILTLCIIGWQLILLVRNQKISSVNSLSQSITSINIAAMEDPKLGRAVAKVSESWNSAAAEEKIVAHYFLFSFFKLLENGWYQKEKKCLDQEQWKAWEAMLIGYFSWPGIRNEWWPKRRNGFSKKFAQFVEDTFTSKDQQISTLDELFGLELGDEG